jgi:hypothetical protein
MVRRTFSSQSLTINNVHTLSWKRDSCGGRSNRGSSRWPHTFVSSVVYQSRAREAHTLAGDKARERFQKWLSPPDPSINYNTARSIHHDGTATWFTRGETYKRWKSSGSQSLWIHGKGTFLILLVCMLLLTPSVWLGSGIWQKYPYV